MNIARVLVAAFVAVVCASQQVRAQIVAGPILYNDHAYYLVGPASWTSSEVQAVTLGGHLATIEDGPENEWIWDTFSPSSEGLVWIGLHATEPFGTWSWVSGSGAPYRNWAAIDNQCPPEVCGVLFDGGRFGDSPDDPEPCPQNVPPMYGVVEVIGCTGTSSGESTWQGAFPNPDGNWNEATHWTPNGVPDPTRVVRFDLAVPHFVEFGQNNSVAAIQIDGAAVGLNLNGYALMNEPVCTGLSYFLGVATVANQTATLALNSAGGIGTLESRGPVSIADGESSNGLLTIAPLGQLDMSGGGTLRIGAGPLSHGTVTVRGLVTGGSCMVGAGISSIGRLEVRPAAAITVAQISLGGSPNGSGTLDMAAGALTATAISIGDVENASGTLELSGGTLDVLSLVIGNRGVGSINQTGGTLRGLSSLTLGAREGGSGTLHLNGPGQSLTFLGSGGQARTVVGNGGSGELHVLGGAILRMVSPGTTGGLGIGIGATGVGNVKVSGVNSNIIGEDLSVLSVGNPWDTGQPSFLLQSQGRARFGSAIIGVNNTNGDVVVTSGATLNFVRPGADALPSQDGLLVGNGARTASLLVSGGGHVNATSAWAYNTHGADPVIKVTGAASTMDIGGPLYIAGDGPDGAKMQIESGATLTAVDTILGYAGGTGLPGDLTLDGPGQLLTNSGTLRLGVASQPNARGRLFLMHGARARTRRLDVNGNYFVTNGTTNNPRLQVGVFPRGVADIQCDTLLFNGDSTALDTAFDITFELGGGIGGHGTWAGSFDNTSGGEVVVPDAPTFNAFGAMPAFIIDGDYSQSATSTLEVAATAVFQDCNEATTGISSFLEVHGVATVGGTVRLTLWTVNAGCRWLMRPNELIGRTVTILEADLVTGEFDRAEFGPGFPTDNVEFTYEPARVLVTSLPPNPPCPADFDHDGFVTGLDFDLYVAAFESGDPSSDFDGDGFVTGLDFDAFVVAFEEGC